MKKSWPTAAHFTSKGVSWQIWTKGRGNVKLTGARDFFKVVLVSSLSCLKYSGHKTCH